MRELLASHPRVVQDNPRVRFQAIGKDALELVVFAYSDIPHIDVMHKASRVIAAGADGLQASTAGTAAAEVAAGEGDDAPIIRLVEKVIADAAAAELVRQ